MMMKMGFIIFTRSLTIHLLYSVTHPGFNHIYTSWNIDLSAHDGVIDEITVDIEIR